MQEAAGFFLQIPRNRLVAAFRQKYFPTQKARTGRISPSGETFPLMAITARVRSGNRDANSKAIFAPSLNPKKIQDGI